MRIRGQLSTTNAIDSFVTGIRVYTEDTLAVLVTNDGPIASPYADWMSREVHFGHTDGVNYINYDIKSARKMEELGQGLLFAYDAITATSFNLDLSIGLKLP